MIEIDDKIYYLDLDAFTSIITIDNGDETTTVETEVTKDYKGDEEMNRTEHTREFDKGHVINAPKYDLIRMCLEVVLTYHDEVDDTLGLERALGGATLPFKFSFNTLVQYGILKIK